MVISPCPILTGTCHVPVKAAKEETAVKAAAQLRPVSDWLRTSGTGKRVKGGSPAQ